MTGRYRIEKLVRDLIPDLIRREGRVPILSRLDDQAGTSQGESDVRVIEAATLHNPAHPDSPIGGGR